jgi:hypothetical protein
VGLYNPTREYQCRYIDIPFISSSSFYSGPLPKNIVSRMVERLLYNEAEMIWMETFITQLQYSPATFLDALRCFSGDNWCPTVRV